MWSFNCQCFYAFAPFSLPLLEQNHGFDMMGIWKEVKRLNLIYQVPLAEQGQISGQGRRVAGDVDDLIRHEAQNLFDHLSVYPRSWWISNQKVRMKRSLWQKHLAVSTEKFTVIYGV
jgi:hypothetical protein